MPVKATKKLNKRAKHLKKGKKLEATKPLTPLLLKATQVGEHLKTATLSS